MQLAPLLEAAGNSAREEFSSFTKSINRQHAPRRVAFVVNQLVWVAHVITILEIIECMQSYALNDFEFHLIALSGGVEPKAANRCAALDVKVHRVQSQPKNRDLLQVILALRKICDQFAVDAAVWVSTPILSHFAFAMRIAPVQVFFSMKFKTIAPRHADGLLALHSIAEPIKRYGDLEWRMGRMYLPHLFNPTLAEEAAKLREQYSKFRLLAACIGREEKINSPDFLSAIVELLRRNRDVAFLWTGRRHNPSIQRAFRDGGILNQTFYVGWVDTQLYAHAIDLFLDSFPFPCGRTAFEAMAAEKPVVFFRSEEALSTGVIMTIDPLLNGDLGSEEDRQLMRDIFIDQNGQSAMPIADTPEEYRSLAQQLIDSEDRRKKPVPHRRVLLKRL